MSFASQMKHDLTVTRVPMNDEVFARDDYGQPAPGTPITTSVRGLVQPKSAREMNDSRSAGAELSDHTIFLPPMDLAGSDTITYRGERYAITGIARFDYGTRHLEVDARRVGPVDVTEVEGS